MPPGKIANEIRQDYRRTKKDTICGFEIILVYKMCISEGYPHARVQFFKGILMGCRYIGVSDRTATWEPGKRGNVTNSAPESIVTIINA
jgi:hypothetical protein